MNHDSAVRESQQCYVSPEIDPKRPPDISITSSAIRRSFIAIGEE
jgi:hypothetical protein